MICPLNVCDAVLVISQGGTDYNVHHGVQLDEFQDVSYAQYRLLKALTSQGSPGGRQRVTIVGDGDQAIYDFRGADVQLFEVKSPTSIVSPNPPSPSFPTLLALPSPASYP